MDNISYSVFICLAVSLLFMLTLIEKQARKVVLFIILGAFSCIFVSEINSFILTMMNFDLLYVTTTITPITEELVKTIPVIYYALFISCDLKQLISVSFACGIGFALMENLLILFFSPNPTVIDALGRVLGSGLVHGLCTVMIGFGISSVSKKKKYYICGTFALLSLAIIYHASYNLLLQSRYSRAGILLPVLTYLPLNIMIARFSKKEAK